MRETIGRVACFAALVLFVLEAVFPFPHELTCVELTGGLLAAGVLIA
jgi:hypothetical protein